MTHPFRQHSEHRAGRHRAKQFLSSSGAGKPPAMAPGADAGDIPSSIAGAMPGGMDTPPMARGGRSKARLDKYARGGAVKKGQTTINIAVVGGGKDKDDAAAPPMPPPMAAAPPPPPPMPPPGMMPPPGAGGMKPPGMMKRGGRIQAFKKGGRIHMTAGSDSGVGRLQKAGKKISGKKG